VARKGGTERVKSRECILEADAIRDRGLGQGDLQQ